MKNDVKHPHFKHNMEYYLKGLIAGKYKLREVSVSKVRVNLKCKLIFSCRK